MVDALDLMKRGALVQKRERLAELYREVDQQIQTMQINTFRIHDEDLDSIKEHLVLAAAQKLVPTLAEARRLQSELEA